VLRRLNTRDVHGPTNRRSRPSASRHGIPSPPGSPDPAINTCPLPASNHHPRSNQQIPHRSPPRSPPSPRRILLPQRTKVPRLLPISPPLLDLRFRGALPIHRCVVRGVALSDLCSSIRCCGGLDLAVDLLAHVRSTTRLLFPRDFTG
jgi:hypothetical protein